MTNRRNEGETKMKKWLISLLAVLLALPVFGSAVFAEETVVYEDGTYDIPFVVKHATEDKESSADRFLTKPAKLTVENGVNIFQIELTSSSMIKSFQVPNGEAEVVSEDTENDKSVVEFTLDGDLNKPVEMKIHVVVPGFYDTVHTVRTFFDTKAVPNVKDPEAPSEPQEPTKPEEPAESEEPVEPVEPTEPVEPEQPVEEPVTKPEEVEDTPNNEDTVFYEPTKDVKYINFVTDSNAVNRQFDNPAIVFEKDGKTYIHLSGSGAQYFKYLAINDTEVTWGDIAEDGTFTVQFEHTGSLSDELVMNMLIAAGPREMEHNVPFSFDESSKRPVKEPEEDNTVFFNVPDDAHYINFVTDSSAVNRQFNNPAIIFEKDGKTFIHLSGSGAQYFKYLAINDTEVTWGDIAEDGTFTVQFEHTGSLSDELMMNMLIAAGPREMEHNVPFTFDLTSMRPMVEIETDEEKEVKDEKNAETPNQHKNEVDQNEDYNKAYKVNYRIVQENSDEPSIADEYFTGEALLIEKDGKKYLQFTSTNPEFIKYLETEYGMMVVVKQNADGSAVYQVEVPDNFSISKEFDIKNGDRSFGSVRKADHITRVIFDEGSLKEIESDEITTTPIEKLPVKETTKGSKLDPNTPEKPELDNEENNQTKNTETSTNTNALNPKTGENTNIMLYVLLLIASAIPLAIKAKRHFA